MERNTIWRGKKWARIITQEGLTSQKPEGLGESGREVPDSRQE